jgi:peptidoglycan pentaglycine glycine transferase (the first glycine)
MLKEIPKDEYHEAWRRLNGSPLQSWQWGELKSETWEVERLGIFDKEELISVVTIFLRAFPLSALTRILGFKYLAYIPRGLAIQSVKYFSKVLKELTEYLQEKKVAFILLDPEKDLLIKGWNKEFEKALKAEGWKVAGTSIEPNQTNVIRISKSEEKLFAAMKPKWRRNIKKAKRHGIEIRESCDRHAVDEFYSVISEVAESTNFKIRSKEYFRKMWDVLSQDGLIRIFVATSGEEVVSTYLILVTDHVACEIYGGSTKKGRDLEASYLLKWEIMRAMKAGGRKFYDHWGVAPKDSDNHPLSGISYFKSGFGGKYVQFLPQYVKVFNPLAYLGYKLFGRR